MALKQAHFLVTDDTLAISTKMSDVIINHAAKQIKAFQMQHIHPQYLVLWTGYMDHLRLLMLRSIYKGAYTTKLLGLEIIWTEKPNIMEVY